MNKDKVNGNSSLTGGGCDNAAEGLRVLARMIARRLLARKSGVDGPHPREVSPSGGVDQKTNSTVPDGFGNKPEVPPSDYKKLDAGSPDEKGDGDD